MSRHRFALAVLFAGLLLLATLPATAQLDLGDYELGEIVNVCIPVCSDQTCNDSGTVESIEIAPPFAIKGIRIGEGPDPCANDPLDSTAATLPATPPAGQILYFDLQFVAGALGTFTEPIVFNGTPASTPFEADVLPPAACPPSDNRVLCLQDDRFTVRTFWRTQFGTRGDAPRVQGVASDDSGLFYFFNPNNWEILLKVLDGCGVNDHYWVFAAATTNVEYTITVTDTQADVAGVYTNPLGSPAAPIQDTGAFATCP